MTLQTVTRQPAKRRPAGFTLIELVIVISIIAVLIALLVPTTISVLGDAKSAEAQAEMTAIASSIATFKSEFGQLPPSYISFVAADGTMATLPSPTKAILRSMFPQIQFNLALQTSLTTAGLWGQELYGPEALVFFLGGVRKSNGTVFTAEMAGFSKNPANPFAQPASASSTRLGPFVDFDASRLGEITRTANSDGLSMDPHMTFDDPATPASEFAGNPLAYTDKLEKSLPRPLLYLSTAATNSYNAKHSGLIQATVTDPATYPWNPYAKSSTSLYNPTSFQLISPGLDGEYGKGGLFNEAEPAEGPDADNLANFASGELGG